MASGMNYERRAFKGTAHRPTSERVVGEDAKPKAKVPRNILVDPLRTPPMEPIKGQDS